MTIRLHGDYNTPIASRTTSLLHRPLNIDGTEILNTSIRMAVIQLNPTENRIIQIITPANTNKSIICFRTSNTGNFNNSEWVIIKPSNTLEISQEEVEDFIITTYDFSINNAHIVKKNGVVELTLDITLNEDITANTKLFEISKDILNVKGSYNFIALATTDYFANTSYYPFYIRSQGHDNTEIMSRKTIESGNNVLISFTCVSL